jgi:hypothetical protein
MTGRSVVRISEHGIASLRSLLPHPFMDLPEPRPHRMPVAWNDLCPQIPGSAHPDAPESIFFAGRGGVRLR